MANWWDGNHHNNDGGNDVENTILTRIEFLDFCDENQQFHDLTQQNPGSDSRNPATLLTWNPNCDDEERSDNLARGPPHHGPNWNRQQDYNEKNCEDKEYVEGVLRNHRGPTRDNGWDYQE